MTNTSNPVRRETLTTINERPVIVELRGTFLMMRLKHARDKAYRVINYEDIWNVANYSDKYPPVPCTYCKEKQVVDFSERLHPNTALCAECKKPKAGD